VSSVRHPERAPQSCSAFLPFINFAEEPPNRRNSTPYLTFGAQVRRLDLRPGDAITFVAHVAALDAERAYLGGDVDAPLRLVRPAKVARA